jgi:hypothetical protein
MGGREVGGKAPVEARAEPTGKAREGVWWLIAGQDDLTAGRVQVVEGVEEFLLRLLLSSEELDIVDEESVRVAVLGAEFIHAALAGGLNVFRGELLGGDIEYLHVRIGEGMGNGMQEMRFAEAAVTVDEQWVMRSRCCSDGYSAA